MISLSNSDTSTLCRYLRDAAAFYTVHSITTRDTDRARLMSILSDKVAVRIIRNQCQQLQPLIKDIQS